MKRMHGRHILWGLGAGLLAVSTALLAGCKGNASAAAVIEKSVAPPPAIQAGIAITDPLAADPLNAPAWQNAHWMSLGTPIDSSHTTSPVSAALLYSSTQNMLYAAFVSDRAAGNVAQDMVSVFLDSSLAGEGNDMFQITISNAGLANCTWIRDAAPPSEPREDGSPDSIHPLSKIPGISVGGLVTRVAEGNRDGTHVWMAVVAIPMKNLPLPLRADAKAASHWKVNLIRTTLLGGSNNGMEQLQANLSPVYVGGQQVAPYRMADLYLDNMTSNRVAEASADHTDIR